MAYTPINWQTGDTITAEKMNKMDNGWSVETSSSTVFTETVTTSLDPDYPDYPAWGDFQYSSQITADTITVTFNGTDYQCQKVDAAVANAYGGWGADGPDFTNIPFAILSEEGYNSICTPESGTYEVNVWMSSTTVETSEDFSAACNNCVDTSMMPMECVSGVTTMADIGKAYNSGRILFFKPYGNQRIKIHYITAILGTPVAFIPADPNVTASIENNVFIVTTSV